jgi:hypothetical protein
MTTTINASTSTGLVQTADTSGIIKVQSNGVTTNALAWVNFGYVSSAITIRSNYNVSSVTRSSTGVYQINFTNALADANYAGIGSCSVDKTASYDRVITIPANTQTTAAVDCATVTGTTNASIDCQWVGIVIFGN